MFWLVLGFVGLFFVAAVQQGDPAISQVSKTTLIAVLKDPLSLFAERSPGGRAEGALIPVKERVLSTVRERDPAGTLPGVEDPVVAGVPEGAAPAGPAPEERVLSGEREGLPGGGAPGGVGGPGGFAPFGGGPGMLAPENFATAPPDTGGPGDPGDPGLVPGGPGNPGIPGVPPGLPGGGAPVPEPATWAMMILGFFAIGAALRRRNALPCAR